MPSAKARAMEILGMSSQEIIHRLQSAGETYTTICAATNLSRSQVSLAANGKRTLSEAPYRALALFGIERKVL